MAPGNLLCMVQPTGMEHLLCAEPPGSKELNTQTTQGLLPPSGE